jgi:beta-glucosidase
MPFVDPKNMYANMSQPLALRNGVNYLHEAIGKPVFVSENGLDTDDDERRRWYIPQVLAGLHESIAAGVPVIGYCHWSLLDNFEWLQGYKPRFGLVAVDRETFRRTPKPSAALLGGIARRNAL